MSNHNATVDVTCSQAFGTEKCGAGWKECKHPEVPCVDYFEKQRRREPRLPRMEESEA